MTRSMEIGSIFTLRIRRRLRADLLPRVCSVTLQRRIKIMYLEHGVRLAASHRTVCSSPAQLVCDSHPASGSENENTAPPCERFAAQMRPPWSSMIFLQMESPNPVPCALP